MAHPRADLAALARGLALPGLQLAIAGEGNLSMPTGSGTLLVTPSGSRLAELTDDDLVEVSTNRLVGALDTPMPDAEWLDVIMDSRLDPAAARPTVEVALHAVIAHLVGPAIIAHTHPTHLLPVLCSGRATQFATTRLFPDHIVALGTADAVVPYIDPGRELAAAVRDALVAHRERYGEWPRQVLAENHGVFILGSTVSEVMDRTLMAVKAARVFTAGGTVGLSAGSIQRIAGREDEGYRQAVLAR